ncbi:MAG: hypothetical protein Q8O62_09965 [Aequorivita sp.]|nr:hypothetical protein [Aequorivita sp.]
MSLKVKFFAGWLKPTEITTLSTWNKWVEISENNEKEGKSTLVFHVPKAREVEIIRMIENKLQNLTH